MNMSWFMWVWALMAVLVVSGVSAVVVVGLTVLRLVRRNWTRLVSEALSRDSHPEPEPAPRPGPPRGVPHAPRARNPAMRAPEPRATPCPPAEASPNETPPLLRQCQQCGQLFAPQGDEWECPACIQEWREYLALRRQLAYPGVWM